MTDRAELRERIEKSVRDHAYKPLDDLTDDLLALIQPEPSREDLIEILKGPGDLWEFLEDRGWIHRSQGILDKLMSWARGGEEKLCEHGVAVYWNKFNKVVQCHKCGRIFEPVCGTKRP